MSSVLNHQSIRIEDDLGRLTRSIEFAPLLRPIATDDARGGAGFRDLWDVNAAPAAGSRPAPGLA